MKVCLADGTRFDAADWTCPSCGTAPQLLDDVPLFAPELSEGSDSYDEDAFAELAEIEDTNFWFRSRNRLVTWAMGRYFPDARSYLEVGCGNGYVLKGMHERFPALHVEGGELFETGIRNARQRLADVPLLQLDARKLPFDQEFDVIGSFDVLEHIVEDDAVLRAIHGALRPGGGLMVTVPQHRWLWSQADDYACHQRRYTRRELKGRIEDAGFEVVRITSFVSVLLPLMLMSRITQRRPREDYDPWAEMKRSRRIGPVFESLLTAERALIRMGMSLPAGGSLLAIARRR